MHRTNIYLEPEQCEALDRLAADEGTSRAELIRRIIRRALSGDERDLETDLEAIDASFGVLDDIDPVVRAPGDRARHLDRMWRIGS